MVSVIIPVYNQSQKIKKCLESLWRQSFGNYEVIVIDDGSCDNLDSVLDIYKIKFQQSQKDFFVFHQKNQGAAVARNKGFEKSRGRYVIFLDADIVMNPKMLEKMVKTLEKNPDKSYVYSSYKFGFKTFKLWEFSERKLQEMPFIHTSSLIRRRHFPGFDEKIKRLQDWDLWLTMLENGHFGIWIPEVLFQIKSGGTMSSWLPSFFYQCFPFWPSVKRYKKAVNIIKKKHNL